ncbi:MAG: polymer-forming cytoskeletal protein [Lachnospiraceae bacterium]|nr:polymer-forming cytoskeletal protein [Lachnospiraceae bacterium]
MQLDLGLAAVASEQTKEKAQKPAAEAKEKPAKVDPTIEAAANELKSIANIVNNKEETAPEAAAEKAESVQEPEAGMAEEVKSEEMQTTQPAKPVEALKPEDMEGEPVDENAVITKCMTVRGDVLSKGSIEVQGIVEGNVTALGKLNVSGKLQGDAKAAEVFADAAQICGQIHADGTAKIGKDSVIIGNIFASSAVIAGAVKGDIDVHGPVILDSSAIVMGNIKSKSVQINNGAAIEGMCSQCYAENSPSSFFDRFGK